MANTYSQIHIHVVFAVQNRISCIQKSWKKRLYQYIIAIIQKHGNKVLAIGGVSDHIHILFGFRPTQTLSTLIQEIKRDSSEWINETKLVNGKFLWQEGYGAFSYAKSQVSAVCNYIAMQEQHHKKKTFREEYLEMLQKFEVEYDEQYIFKDVE